MKKRLLKYCCIAAVSLGLFASSPAITCTGTPHSESRNVSWDVSETGWEYNTHGWNFTLEEIKEIYEKEYEEGERLENYIRIEEGKYIASEYGKNCEIPESFVKTTLKHLEQMLEKDYAKYIFRLDAFHGHIFIPKELFGKYKDLYFIELIAAYTKDEQLGILYHNTEHLALRNPPKTGEIDPEAQELISKRSVLGWYDGRPLELTYPKEGDNQKAIESNCVDIPDGYNTIGGIHFKATKNGEFAITHPNGEEIRIDISFDAFHYY